jgi:hypothetical protein
LGFMDPINTLSASQISEQPLLWQLWGSE